MCGYHIVFKISIIMILPNYNYHSGGVGVAEGVGGTVEVGREVRVSQKKIF